MKPNRVYPSDYQRLRLDPGDVADLVENHPELVSKGLAALSWVLAYGGVIGTYTWATPGQTEVYLHVQVLRSGQVHEIRAPIPESEHGGLLCALGYSVRALQDELHHSGGYFPQAKSLKLPEEVRDDA